MIRRNDSLDVDCYLVKRSVRSETIWRPRIANRLRCHCVLYIIQSKANGHKLINSFSFSRMCGISVLIFFLVLQCLICIKHGQTLWNMHDFIVDRTERCVCLQNWLVPNRVQTRKNPEQKRFHTHKVVVSMWVPHQSNHSINKKNQ